MKKAIIVEDDAAIRDAICMVLERAGFECSAFAEGNDLLDNLSEVPDIFIIDKQLSGIDGLDICRYLKKEKRSKDIPVLIISASPDVKNLAIDACADAFLEKPFKNSALLELVTKLAG